MTRAIVLAVVAASIIVACAAREELMPKNAVVPAGVNLSGNWQLSEDDETMRRISRAERVAAGADEDIVPSRKSGNKLAKRKAGDTSVHVFLETGRALKVTQTDFGLFISFDRAVVEEYRYGEKREINVGPIVADRVSGWEGVAYVIETLDQEGARLIERYRLDEESGTLVRSIRIIFKDDEQLNVVQVFDPA